MFGSDWPVCLRATDYTGTVTVAESLTAALSSDESAQVYGGTAACWYGADR